MRKVTEIKQFKSIKSFVDLIRSDPSLKVLILGDHDCDGITSSSIMKLIIPHADVHLTNYNTGHGWSKELIEERMIELSNYDYMIILDSGLDKLDYHWVHSKNIFTIIIDHHQWDKPDDLPNTFKILNAINTNSDFIEFCTAMLVGNLVDYNKYPLIKFLMAVGTVGDEQEYKYDNWTIVRDVINGLEKDRSAVSAVLPINLKNLIQSMSQWMTALDMIINVATHINTISRLGDTDESMKLLISNKLMDKSPAEYMKERKEIRDKIKLECTLSGGLIDIYRVYNVPRSFISYIATKESSDRNRPLIVCYKDENSGSARAPKGFNIRETLNSIKGLEAKGHNCACGCKSIEGIPLEEIISRITIPQLEEDFQDNESVKVKKNCVIKEFRTDMLDDYWDLRPIRAIFKTSDLPIMSEPRFFDITSSFFKLVGYAGLDIKTFSKNIPEYVALEYSSPRGAYELKEI